MLHQSPTICVPGYLGVLCSYPFTLPGALYVLYAYWRIRIIHVLYPYRHLYAGEHESYVYEQLMFQLSDVEVVYRLFLFRGCWEAFIPHDNA